MRPQQIPGILKFIISLTFPILTIVSVPFFLQIGHYDGSEKLLWWYEHFRGAYYCNLYIIGSLFILFYLLFNSTYRAGIGVIGFSVVFGIIDSQKMCILNQPFLPGDLLFMRQALMIAKLYVFPVLGAVILLALALFLLLRVKKHVYHFPLPPLVRIVVSIVVLISAGLVVKNYNNVINSLNKQYSLNNEFWNQLGNYHKNGVMYTFMMNITSLSIEKPRSYNKENVESIFNNLPEVKNRPAPVQQLPDVIVVLSESFWDITQISPVKIKRDPLKNFHAIGKKYKKTKLLSPSFGGNTCNAEFEVLTGMSHSYFPPGVIAYNQSITHPVPSIVRVFKENGYRTTGIHTFKQWFWNRTNVYRHFGFDSFISQENMTNPKYKGFYISDQELASQVISTASVNGQPDFIFAISMQNHGPYDLKRYDTLDCPLSTQLSVDADRELNNYVQGLIDADRSLKMIARYIDTTRTPTLLLFFGDHLPGFSRLYDETGFKEKTLTDVLWSHTTSSVWYANYPLKALPDSMISMSFLPLFITQLAGVKTPAYYQFLEELRQTQPLFSLSGNEMATANVDTSTIRDTLSEYSRLCVYDVLFGKQYASRYHHVNYAIQ
ncbi:MAG TPA: sulfatase-like hydrolase/transferase [Chitinispirillaceae bacterium]|nr:sulfatase-like hydrolase/transferase [Chitinispirillaceae bacterium]